MAPMGLREAAVVVGVSLLGALACLLAHLRHRHRSAGRHRAPVGRWRFADTGSRVQIRLLRARAAAIHKENRERRNHPR